MWIGSSRNSHPGTGARVLQFYPWSPYPSDRRVNPSILNHLGLPIARPPRLALVSIFEPAVGSPQPKRGLQEKICPTARGCRRCRTSTSCSMPHAGSGAHRFTVMSVLTLTIGIGACALMMSLVSTILLKPPSVREPDRMEMIWGYYPDANLGVSRAADARGGLQHHPRQHHRRSSRWRRFAGASYNLGDSTSAGTSRRRPGDGRFFQRLASRRRSAASLSAPTRLREGSRRGTERRALAAPVRRGPDIIGRVLTLNGEPYTVIGVAARGFAFPRGSEMPGDFQFAAMPDVVGPAETPDGRDCGPRNRRASSGGNDTGCGTSGHGSRDGRGETLGSRHQEFAAR